VQPYLNPQLLKRLTGQTLNPLDVAALLNVFLGNWQPVFNYLDPRARTYAHEVIDIRNIVYHWPGPNDIPLIDACRHLDTMRRLLDLIGASPEARECERLWQKLGCGGIRPGRRGGDVTDAILNELKHGPMCDDCLSDRTGITPRQTINQAARRLERKRRLTRKQDQCPICGKNKFVNRIP
jgi:hypothetical protein